ncbi:MAG: hotdog fold thioesterase [Bacteroidetes bacterium]|nr:hotdog fold thioesterase [Bacteroidota bacterium]
MIWKNKSTVEQLQMRSHNTLSDHLGIVFTEVGEDYLCAKMPVDHRTVQPMGMLHGGASVVLAETLGSVAGVMTVDANTQSIVGLDINANHMRPVKEGFVYGRVSPLHLGKTTQVWHIEIKNEEGKLVCVSRLTIAIIELK